MTKAKRIILIVALSILAAVSVTAAGIFAYFSSSASSNKRVNTNITDNTFVATVATFDDLYKVSQSEYYNDKKIASTTRKVIRLANDLKDGKLTLPADLRITADVHIDLNEKTLDLNGHTLTLQHAYAGSFLLYNGTMSANNGQLVIDTPNAVTEFDKVIGLPTDLSATDSYVKVISQEFDYSAYAALYMVGEALSSDLEKRPARLTYAEFNAQTGDKYTYTPSVFLATKTHESTSEACAYVADGRDIVLPTRYLATGYTVTYSSGDSSVLSNAGNALKAGDVTLTVTVSDGVEGSANSVSVDFKVHVVALNTTSIAEPLIKSYLAAYYQEGEITVGTAKHNGYYLFSNGIELPMQDDDLGLTLSYQPLLADQKTEAETTSGAENGVYLFEPNDQCAYLRVSVNGSLIFDLPVYSNYVANEETAARLIINRLYGGAIVYDSTKPYTELYTIDDIKDNGDLAQYVTDYNITGISYDIKAKTAEEETNNVSVADDFYVITANGLERKPDTTTPPEKLGFITCTFTFGEGETETTLPIDLYVLYVTGNEGTTNNFLIYYNNYDGKVPLSTSKTFEMPFSYGGGMPYSMYEFALADNYTLNEETGVYTLKEGVTSDFSAPAAISLVLKYDEGLSNEFSYSGTQTLSEQFNTWLTTNSLTLEELAKQNAVWEITVTAEKSIFEDSRVLLLYKYTFANNTAGNAPEWATYQAAIESEDGTTTTRVFTESTVSEFTLKGGVFYSTDSTSDNAVKDGNLFKWMQETFNATGEDLIVNDALALPAVLDVTEDTALQSVTNWSGIRYLTGVTTVNLDGVDFSATQLTERLGNMENLQSLSLKNCDITQISGLKLTKLRTLNVANNDIADFSWLTTENFPALQRAYVYGNEKTDGYQGSTGMSNYQTFEDLVRVGVTVYNTLNANKVSMPFAESTELNDYRRLKSIVYQSVLKENVSIETVYSKYKSLNVSDFNLEGSYTGDIIWDYGGGTNANDATWFSATVTTTSGVALTVKFYVDRIQ